MPIWKYEEEITLFSECSSLLNNNLRDPGFLQKCIPITAEIDYLAPYDWFVLQNPKPTYQVWYGGFWGDFSLYDN